MNSERHQQPQLPNMDHTWNFIFLWNMQLVIYPNWFIYILIYYYIYIYYIYIYLFIFPQEPPKNRRLSGPKSLGLKSEHATKGGWVESVFLTWSGCGDSFSSFGPTNPDWQVNYFFNKIKNYIYKVKIIFACFEAQESWLFQLTTKFIK